MGIISRGFSGRRSAADVKLPPGQYLTTDFPVLSAGPTPHIPLDQWEFVIDDGTNVLRRWDWKSFRDLPTETFAVDLHCVTRWSKLGTSWEGVSVDTMLADVKTDASYAMARSYGDYTTNLPLKDLRNGQAWIAFRFDNKDLAPEHGGPARLLVPLCALPQIQMGDKKPCRSAVFRCKIFVVKAERDPRLLVPEIAQRQVSGVVTV